MWLVVHNCHFPVLPFFKLTEEIETVHKQNKEKASSTAPTISSLSQVIREGRMGFKEVRKGGKVEGRVRRKRREV